MSRSPIVRGPRDLPELRAWLVRMWAPGSPFDLTASMRIRLMDSAGQARAAGDHTSAWNHSALKESTLWWVDANMVDLIETSSADLPPVTLHDELVPHDNALVVYERPLPGLDSENPEGILVDAVMWSRSSLPRVDGPGRRRAISMMSYRCLRPAEGLSGRELADAATQVQVLDAIQGKALRPGESYNLTDEMWLPLGRSDWVLGDDWDDVVHPAQSDDSHRSQAEDRRWLATLWALAAQPNIVNVSDAPSTRPQRREAKRRGYNPSPVKVVGLRQNVYEDSGAERTETVDSAGRRTYHVRWPVTGHWRNQAYGPGRQLRRPTYVAPYIKGPEGAPLRKGATVHVLAGDAPRPKRKDVE